MNKKYITYISILIFFILVCYTHSWADGLSATATGNAAGAAAGDLSGSYPNPTVNQSHFSTQTCTSGTCAISSTTSLILCDATAGAVTLTLPATSGSNRDINVFKIDTSMNTCSPSTTGSDVIDPSTTVGGAANSLSLSAQGEWFGFKDVSAGHWKMPRQQPKDVLWANSFTGSDLGSEINNCLAALPTSAGSNVQTGGTCFVTNKTGQSITTQVSMSTDAQTVFLENGIYNCQVASGACFKINSGATLLGERGRHESTGKGSTIQSAAGQFGPLIQLVNFTTPGGDSTHWSEVGDLTLDAKNIAATALEVDWCGETTLIHDINARGAITNGWNIMMTGSMAGCAGLQNIGSYGQTTSANKPIGYQFGMTDATYLGAWASGTYSVGKLIKDSNNNFEIAVVAGTTAGTAPTWPTNSAANEWTLTTDGTVKWAMVKAQNFSSRLWNSALSCDTAQDCVGINSKDAEVVISGLKTESSAIAGGSINDPAILIQNKSGNYITLNVEGIKAIGDYTGGACFNNRKTDSGSPRKASCSYLKIASGGADIHLGTQTIAAFNHTIYDAVKSQFIDASGATGSDAIFYTSNMGSPMYMDGYGTTGDGTAYLGQASFRTLTGNQSISTITAPGTCTLSGPGTTGGATTYQYACVAFDGAMNPTSNGTLCQTTTGQASLSTANYAEIDCPIPAGAVFMTVVGGGTSLVTTREIFPPEPAQEIQAISSGGSAVFYDSGASYDPNIAYPYSALFGDGLGGVGGITLNGGAVLNSTGGTPPSITGGCNGTGSAVTGTNNSGVITTQNTAATTCTMTFSTSATWNHTPNCIFTDANASTSPVAYSEGLVTTTAVVVDFASATSKKIAYMCM